MKLIINNYLTGIHFIQQNFRLVRITNKIFLTDNSRQKILWRINILKKIFMSNKIIKKHICG